MTDEFNKQFIIFGFKQLDDPAFLSFIGTAEFKTFLILLRYIWRGGAHRLGLEDRYAKEKLLVAAVDRTFIAHKLGLQDETRISKHLTKLEELKIIRRTRTGRETIFVLGEWIDISEEQDGSAKKEWFYYERVFGKSKQQSSPKETRKGSDGEQLSDVAQNATSDVQNTPHQRWLQEPHQRWLQEPQQTWREEPRSNKYKINKKTVNVNGDVDTATMQQQSHEEMDRTDLRRLPDLDQDREKTQYVAEFILDELGDEHSQAFYYLVAAKVPEQVIRKTLSEIRNDGARSPARVFAHRMKQYAADRLAGPNHRDIRSSIAELSRNKMVGSHSEERL